MSINQKDKDRFFPVKDWQTTDQNEYTDDQTDADSKGDKLHETDRRAGLQVISNK
jgi:hypothetical protein